MTRTQKLVGAGVVAVLALVLAAFLYLRDDAPDAPNIGDAAAAGADDEGTAEPSEASGDSADDEAVASADDDAGTPDGDQAAGASGAVTGTWTIDAGNPDDIDAGTFAGYKVKEELARIGETTAFGRSPAVTGEVVLTEDTVESVDVTADLTQLTSDSGNRDNAIRSRGLETGQFPEATFVSTSAVELPAGAADGEPVTVDVPGELTLHGVTNAVTVPLEAQLVGERIAVVTSFPIVMSEYDITPPQAGPVLAIADEGTMELQLFLSRG